MILSKHMQTILLALLAESKRIAAIMNRPQPVDVSREPRAAQVRQKRTFEHFGVPHDLARWLGHVPTAAESAVFSRTLRSMEMAGLVERISRWGGTRTTHVCLTARGRAEAERLAKQRDAELDELMRGMMEFPLIDE